MTDTFVVDGYCNRPGGKGFIIDVKRQGHHATNIIVVFDGYQSSPKDHAH